MRLLTVFATVLLPFTALFGQQDTLHLNYHHSQTTLHDTSIAKLDKWIATLKGQKTDIKVYAYYSKGQYEKFAQERADNLFIILNRKARTTFSFESIGPKKGKEWQRSMVDIVYSKPGAAVATDKPKTETKTDEKGKSEAQPEVKAADNRKPAPKPKPEKAEPAKKETAAQPASEKPGPAPDTEHYRYDTVFVNGKMKVTKTKLKPIDTEHYTYDSTYVNGQLKVIKKKK
jgi:hypothetical protein